MFGKSKEEPQTSSVVLCLIAVIIRERIKYETMAKASFHTERSVRPGT
jgi:hypothetical protein